MGESGTTGSRSLDRAQTAAHKIAETIGQRTLVAGLENENAVKKAEIVVITVPFGGLSETLKAVRPSLTPGQTIVNVTVPLETAVGGKPTRTVGLWSGSAGELVAATVPKGVKVVSAFNNVSAELLRDLSRPFECDILICGNDEEAKRQMMELVTAIPGARGIDAGPLENSKTVEQLTALLIGLNIRYRTNNAGIRITGISPSA
jgi:8-hydroxy-5-deazaflavin:NADPH oxidoreductase